MKLSNHTIAHVKHIRRRNRNKGIIPAIIAIGELEKQFIGIDTPAMAQDRIAMQGSQGYIENCPELYGKSIAQTQSRYYDPLPCHSGKNDADCEMDEQSAAIIGATIHAGDVEAPMAPANRLTNKPL